MFCCCCCCCCCCAMTSRLAEPGCVRWQKKEKKRKRWEEAQVVVRWKKESEREVLPNHQASKQAREKPKRQDNAMSFENRLKSFADYPRRTFTWFCMAMSRLNSFTHPNPSHAQRGNCIFIQTRVRVLVCLCACVLAAAQALTTRTRLCIQGPGSMPKGV